MSLLIAIVIFLAQALILTIPVRVTLNMNRDKLIYDEYINVGAFNEMENDSFDFSQIRSGNFEIENNFMTSSVEDNGEYEYYTFDYTNNGRETHIHIVFDVYNNVDKAIAELALEYNEQFDLTNDTTNEAVNKRTFVIFLTYIELQQDENLVVEDKFRELNGLTNQALAERFDYVSLFDIYNIETNPNQDDFLVVFNYHYIKFQLPIYDQETREIHNAEHTRTTGYYSSSKQEFDVREMSNLNEFGQTIARIRVDIQIASVISSYVMQTMGFVFLLIPLVVLIFWLFFRRSGLLKRYKEYYNVAAITSIAPTIVMFILLWLFPYMLMLYAASFSIFYMITVSKINLSDDII